MAISTTVDVITNAIFTPRDLRDPLGVWGARLGVTGDGSPSGGVKVGVQVTAAERAAYVYTAYSANFSILNGTGQNAQGLKLRLLTNWPNIDPTAGVQGYSTLRIGNVNTDADFSAPIAGIGQVQSEYITVNDRFLVLYDPRPLNVPMTIVEMEMAFNDLNDLYVFEVYGYYWDRAVMDTPGGLRHPGSN